MKPCFLVLHPVSMPTAQYPMGDHLLGCGHGPLRIRRHDALRQVLYHALRNDHLGVRIEQHCASDRQLRPGDVFHPSFQNEKPGYFDITAPGAQHSAASVLDAWSWAGIAAEAGVAVKDQLHAAAVEESGGEFYPIVVESFGVELDHRNISRKTSSWNSFFVWFSSQFFYLY